MELVSVICYWHYVHRDYILGLWLQVSHADLDDWEHPPVIKHSMTGRKEGREEGRKGEGGGFL